MANGRAAEERCKTRTSSLPQPDLRGTRLQAKNVRCWKFDENAKWGEPVWGEIDAAIRHYDKLVVICSRQSLQSQPVIRDLEHALQKEDREHKNVLFPFRVDDYLFDAWDHPRTADVVSKVAGDFTAWENPEAYA